ncbi:MAG TPA: PAS domain-containing protein [Pyrinomonadaceae bacterium]|nr:PAS domain-containing protein [Pyrinomonadaceae bacterium]
MVARQTSEEPHGDEQKGRDENDPGELARRLEQRVRVLETTLSHIPDFAYIFDREGRFAYVNQALLDLWGLNLEEAAGKNFFDLKYPGELAAKLQRQIQQVFDTAQGLTDETLYTSPTGKGGYYEYIFRPVFSADGTVEMVAGSTRDITQRKQAEASLRDSEQLLRHLTRNIPGGSLNIFDKDLRYLFAEGQGLSHVGLSTEKLVGKTLADLFPPEAVAYVTPFYRRALAGESLDFELEVGGQWFIVNTAPLEDEHGRINAVIALAQEITERKLAERERERLVQSLKLERLRMAYIFEHSPSFVAVLRSPEHIFELVNPPYRQLVGGRDVTGKPVREAVPEAEEQGFLELLDNVYRTGEPYVGKEVPVQLSRAGKLDELFLNFVYQPIFEADGTVSGIFVHGVEVTDQVRARREAEAANRLKDEFLATLSHELRTPLTAVLGWVRMLRDGNLNEATAARALTIIERNAEAQQQLIEEVLDVSRIITGKLRLEVLTVELIAVVEAAVDGVRPAAEAKNIELSVGINSEANLVSGDPARLQQVISNLLTNAIKFTPKEGRVEVRLERAGATVQIKVIDNGLGIEPDFLPHVFDRFRQADSSTTRQYSGLGLGLAVVRYLVEQHGGSVSAQSEGENRGSTFTIELPVSVLRIDAEGFNLLKGDGRADAGPVDAALSLEGVRVLVVEDQPDARELLSVLLRQYGARVETSGSAVEAVSALRREKADVLVSDIGMPGEDGYWLIKEVRSLGAHLGGDVPAVALTAYASASDREHAFAAGFHAHVSKPIEPAALISAVAQVVKRSSIPLHTPNAHAGLK